MRILLTRNRDNSFEIPNSFIHKAKARIIGVYEDNTLLSPDEYKYMGPRKVKVLRAVKGNVYGRIININIGNKIVAT